MTLFDWTFRALAVLLAILACGVVVRALWGDRLRGLTKSRRCPKCWYDLTGAIPSDQSHWLCTECGHTITSERHLHRARRRWPWAAAGAAVGVLAIAAWAWPTARRDGWRALVPTALLVRHWPVDEVGWLEGGGQRDAMGAELDRRMDSNRVSPSLQREWASRVDAAYTSLGRRLDEKSPDEPATPPSSDDPTVLATLDLAHTIGALTSMARPEESSDDQLILWDTQSTLASCVMHMVAPDQWLQNGGTAARTRWCDSTLLIIAPRTTASQSTRLVKALSLAAALAYEQHARAVRVVALDTGSTQIIVRDGGGTPDPGPCDLAECRSRAGDLRARIIGEVEPDSWQANGGETGQILCLEGLLIIRATPTVQARIDEFLLHLSANP